MTKTWGAQMSPCRERVSTQQSGKKRCNSNKQKLEQPKQQVVENTEFAHKTTLPS